MKILKQTIFIVLGLAVILFGGSYIVYESNMQGQLHACNVTLKGFIETKMLGLYCEREVQGVVIKSAAARKTLHNVTFDSAPAVSEPTEESNPQE